MILPVGIKWDSIKGNYSILIFLGFSVRYLWAGV